jgi:hypothetical protein
MTDAEVMTTASLAALDYGGNLEKARDMLQMEGYITNMLGKSRFNRRWHRNAGLFLTLFSLLGETWKQLNSNSIYVIDSFPVAACDNYRIQRCRLYRGEERDVLPLCREEKIGVILYSPLASGRLTREWSSESTLRSETDQIAKSKYDATAETDRRVVERVVERVAEIAEKHGVPRVHIALA